MSILFGIRQAEGHAVEECQLQSMALATARFAPDGTFLKTSGRIGMGFQPYRTHLRSNLEWQPIMGIQGNMLTFDGRLDNASELCTMLGLKCSETPDSMIVLQSFSRWGEECFSRFVGDWALALWFPAERSLYLARDHAGTRTLYYELTKEGVIWATHLEPFLAEKSDPSLDGSFAAAFLSSQPIGDLTPYKNIRAVSPAHYLVVREGEVVRKPHWEWMVRDRIRYASDAEYDENFLYLLRQAVERRTGPGAPIIAELSGGVDSSSIVCMSDYIRKGLGAAPADFIDTVSYYDDSEPNWNETPYFTAVERARGKNGVHLELSCQRATFEPPDISYLWPGPEERTLFVEKQFENHTALHSYRVVLAGMGGDELLGGPPDPLPELADYLVSLRLRALLTQSFNWGLAKRVPMIRLLRETSVFVMQVYSGRKQLPVSWPVWLSASLRREAAASQRLRYTGRRLSYLPSSIDAGLTWWLILETLYRPAHRLLARREYRYPFLDRELVDFLLRIPSQLLKEPGRRRALMRRALQHIVPVEILERKRKARVTRGPAVALLHSKPKLLSLLSTSRLEEHNFALGERLRSALANFDASSNSGMGVYLMRAIQLELWMKRQTKHHASLSFAPAQWGDKRSA
jgi:asparagine synthase (glutamine-hydrolysing)